MVLRREFSFKLFYFYIFLVISQENRKNKNIFFCSLFQDLDKNTDYLIIMDEMLDRSVV